MRAIVAEKWDTEEAEQLRIVSARQVSFAHVVDLRHGATRTIEMSDGPNDVTWPWDAHMHSSDAGASLPSPLRERAQAKAAEWARHGSPIRVDSASDLIVECALSKRGERLFVALSSGLIVGYRHQYIGARRVATATGLFFLVVVPPLIGPFFGMPGCVGGGVISILVAVALVTHYAGHGEGGASAWMKVR